MDCFGKIVFRLQAYVVARPKSSSWESNLIQQTW